MVKVPISQIWLGKAGMARVMARGMQAAITKKWIKVKIKGSPCQTSVGYGCELLGWQSLYIGPPEALW